MLMLLLLVSSQGLALTMTVGDGDFSHWSFSQVVGNGPDAWNYATTTTIADPSDAGNTILDNTTRSYTGGKSAWGVALFNGFVFDPGVSGGLDAISMQYDFLSGPGAFGNGQAIDIVLFQDNHFYGVYTGGTRLSSSWTTRTTDQYGISDFDHSWAGDSFDAVLQLPDWSANGGPIQFGFAAGNHISRTLTNYYDNWSISIDFTSIPEPSTILLLGLGLGGFVTLRSTGRSRA